MTLPVNPHRGEYALKLGDREILLRATFANTRIFENKVNQGTYALWDQLQTGNVKVTGLVDLIWCYCDARDTEGLTEEDIFQAINGISNINLAFDLIQNFYPVVLGLDPKQLKIEQEKRLAEEASGDAPVAKKKTIARRPKDSSGT